ncbi:MAG: hypothetical protein H7Z41_00245, partial [Cytophagales bacterium]|nr:hypothetical protein [Armatimonadota bacterium]
NAVSIAGAKWSGEGSGNYPPAISFVNALSYDEAKGDFITCKTANALRHFSYISPERHSGGSNYLFADGHAKWHKIQQTLNPAQFLWGKKMYSANDLPIMVSGSTTVTVQ